MGGGDAMDDTSAHFLLEMALLSPEEVEQLRKAERRKLAREEKERKEKERKEMIARLTGEYLQGLSQPSSSSSPRGNGKRGRRRSSRSHVFFLAASVLRQGRLRRGAEADPHGRPCS